MSIFDRFFDRKVTKEQRSEVRQEIANQFRVNARISSYENLFAQVRPLIDEMKVVLPYGVDDKGEPLSEKWTPELTVLNTPNESMGRLEFMDLALATWLTEKELNIHVHFKGNKIIGYSILPVGCRKRLSDGTNQFQVNAITGTTYYTDAEVMTLRYSRSPRNMDQGVSPATSVEVWAQIDDVLAQYQKAYFENGATPASITFITASSREKYNEKRQKMETGFGGASNKNKTLYVWKQMLDDGSSANEVEVKPIQGNNSTMAIKEIVNIVTDRLNKSVGVSNFILGDDSSAKYDNAELSDQQFTKRRVYPALAMFWSQFQNELDRILGGLGYAISFDLEIPELTDRAKTKAEIASINASTITMLVNAGAGGSATVKALGLGKEWVTVANAIAKKNAEAVVAPPVMDDNKKKETDTLEVKRCCHHHRTTDANGDPIFAETELAEKKIYDALMELAEQIVLENNPQATRAEIEQLVADILAGEAERGATVMANSLAAQVGSKTVAGELRQTIGSGWNLSDNFIQQLNERTHKIIGGYIDFADETKQNFIAKGAVEGWTQEELRNELMENGLPKHRAETIARSETVHAYRTAGIDSTQTLADKYGLKVNLVWRIADDGACDVCKAMNGKKVPIGKEFPDHGIFKTEDGEDVMVGWEHSYYNDYGREPNAHPNCVLGDTKVLADGVKKMMKYNYSGDIVRITTASGRELAMTANHILLTNHGWVRAKNLRKLDKVVAHRDGIKLLMGDDTIDWDKTTVADEFVALSETQGVVATKMPMTAKDFKGDAVENEEVEIILPDRLLRDEGDVSGGEDLCQFDFITRSDFASSLDSVGTLDQLLVGTLASTNGIVGGECERLARLGSKSGHSDTHSLTSATAYNTRLEESFTNSPTANIEALRESFLADAGLIEFDDVIGVEVEHVDSIPVYDLETTSTLYSANGIVVSNCRCYFETEVE